MPFQNKVLRNMELVAKNMRKDKPELVPTDNDIIETTAKIVTKSIPKNQVLTFNEAVNLVSNKTKVDENLVAKGLSRAIAKKDFSVVNNAQGIFVRKNEI